MSRFILGDCVQVMSRFPARAVDFILTDPPYLVGYKDRTGRTLAGDNSAEWLQPACHEMYRVLKNDSLMVSFYAWNRADLFLNAWKTAGLPRILVYVQSWFMHSPKKLKISTFTMVSNHHKLSNGHYFLNSLNRTRRLLRSKRRERESDGPSNVNSVETLHERR